MTEFKVKAGLDNIVIASSLVTIKKKKQKKNRKTNIYQTNNPLASLYFQLIILSRAIWLDNKLLMCLFKIRKQQIISTKLINKVWR